MSYPFSNTAPSPLESGSPKVGSIRWEAKGAILEEQLSYLIEHGTSCKGGCPDCARLRGVEELLLRPFRVKYYANMPPAA